MGRELRKWLLFPQAGSDPGPVTPRGCVDLGAPSSTSSSQGARPSPCPQGVHRLGGELNTAKATMNVQGLRGLRQALMKLLSWPLALLGYDTFQKLLIKGN